MNKLLLSAGLLVSLVFSFAPAARAGICEKLLTPTELGSSSAANSFCVTHTNTNVDVSNNPLYLKNQSAACNLPHLSLPGLPDFGASLKLNMCSILQNVTGAMVQQVNSVAQAAANKAVGAVASKVPGMNASGQINVNGTGTVNSKFNSTAGQTIQNAGNKAQGAITGNGTGG